METWTQMVARFELVTDRLGRPIDKGIFETVVALNMLGIRTVMSCEGHPNRGLPYPWVEVDTTYLRSIARLLEYIASFNKVHDGMLILSNGRIMSQGGVLDELYQHGHKLQEYQDEMAAFTVYLKSQIPPDRMV